MPATAAECCPPSTFTGRDELISRLDAAVGPRRYRSDHLRGARHPGRDDRRRPAAAAGRDPSGRPKAFYARRAGLPEPEHGYVVIAMVLGPAAGHRPARPRRRVVRRRGGRRRDRGGAVRPPRGGRRALPLRAPGLGQGRAGQRRLADPALRIPHHQELPAGRPLDRHPPHLRPRAAQGAHLRAPRRRLVRAHRARRSATPTAFPHKMGGAAWGPGGGGGPPRLRRWLARQRRDRNF